jgi:hypothetical protein
MKTEDLVVIGVATAAALAMLSLRYVAGLMKGEERAPSPVTPEQPPVTPEERNRLIAEHAYQHAVARGFASGDPMQDWLEAEREVDDELAQAGRGVH